MTESSEDSRGLSSSSATTVVRDLVEIKEGGRIEINTHGGTAIHPLLHYLYMYRQYRHSENERRGRTKSDSQSLESDNLLTLFPFPFDADATIACSTVPAADAPPSRMKIGVPTTFGLAFTCFGTTCFGATCFGTTCFDTTGTGGFTDDAEGRTGLTGVDRPRGTNNGVERRGVNPLGVVGEPARSTVRRSDEVDASVDEPLTTPTGSRRSIAIIFLVATPFTEAAASEGESFFGDELRPLARSEMLEEP